MFVSESPKLKALEETFNVSRYSFDPPEIMSQIFQIRYLLEKYEIVDS